MCACARHDLSKGDLNDVQNLCNPRSERVHPKGKSKCDNVIHSSARIQRLIFEKNVIRMTYAPVEGPYKDFMEPDQNMPVNQYANPSVRYF